MYFEYPTFLLLFLLYPLYFLLRALKIFDTFKLPLTFSDWNGHAFQYKNTFLHIPQVLSRFCAFFAFACLILALANPIIASSEKIFTSKGSDILFVLDTSPSMGAKDIGALRRIDAAKNALQKIVLEARGNAFGLVSMALEAALVVPLTLDHNYFFRRLEELYLGGLGDGTALGTGLSVALYHLENSQAPKKVIILLTDGENNAGMISPITAARLIAESNIALYIVGLGTKGDVAIEYFDVATGKMYSGYLSSSFDERELNNLARAGNGEYFSIETLGNLTTLLATIFDKQSVVQKYYNKVTQTFLYYYFALASIILFLLSWIFSRFYLREVFS
ncbi:MAG: VWA domain-containing protein [Treponemataceae bacterium]